MSENKKTILIIEDEGLIALDLEFMLQENGWRVIGPAASVKQALALMAVEMPLVALLDVNLAGELVTPLAEALKASNVPFALATAYADAEMFGGDVLAGVPNAGKPTNERKLLVAVNQLLAGGT
jgi:two-component system, response regulator PdtaR